MAPIRGLAFQLDRATHQLPTRSLDTMPLNKGGRVANGQTLRTFSAELFPRHAHSSAASDTNADNPRVGVSIGSRYASVTDAVP